MKFLHPRGRFNHHVAQRGCDFIWSCITCQFIRITHPLCGMLTVVNLPLEVTGVCGFHLAIKGPWSGWAMHLRKGLYTFYLNLAHIWWNKYIHCKKKNTAGTHNLQLNAGGQSVFELSPNMNNIDLHAFWTVTQKPLCLVHGRTTCSTNLLNCAFYYIVHLMVVRLKTFFVS